jgi:sugar-specific transcriptional regulator TrmB
MTSLSNDLQDLGLTHNQTDVYLVLVRKGSAKAGEIIELTSFHRNIVYTALADLLKLKLISQSSVRGVALYKALSPTRIVSSAMEKCRLAETVAEELSLIQKKVPPQEVIIFEGIDEFRAHAIRSFISAKDDSTIRYLGTSPHWHSVVDNKTEERLVDIQKEKNLTLKGIAIAPFKEIGHWLKVTDNKTSLRFNKLIGSDTNNIEILEDRICIQSFIEPYLVVEITNPEMAKNYQNYFDFLWEQSQE